MPKTVKKLSTPEEMRAYFRNAAIAFAYPTNLDEKMREQSEAKVKGMRENRDYWGLEDENGDITSSMVNHLYDVEFDGHRVLAGAVGNVASLPEARQGGGIRAIYRAQLDEMYEKGYLLSYLFPFSHEFYRKFGYEQVSLRYTSLLDTEQLRDYRCGLRVKMLSGDEELVQMKRLHEHFIAGLNLSVYRRADQWESDTGDPVSVRRYRYLFYRENGEACAYLRFTPDESGGRRERVMQIDELEYDSPEAFRHVLGFIYRLRAQYGQMVVELPENMNLRAMIPEPYRCEVHIKSGAAGRVVNAKLALELLRYPDTNGRFSLAVSDSFMPQNTGNYAVSFSPREVSVSILPYCPGEADAAMEITTFTQLAVGFLDYEAALYRSDFRVNRETETLRRIFVKRNVYFTDRF